VADDPATLDLLEALAAEFSAATGSPVTVLARAVDTLHLSLAAAELANEPPPDLIWADQNALAVLLAAEQVQPLPANIAADSLAALQAAARADGALYGAPMAASGALLLLYNRELVAAPPTTSDELILRARTASSANTAGLVMFWDDVRWFLPWFYAFGGALAGGDGSRPTLDTPALSQTIELMRELYVAAPPEGEAYIPGQRRFAAGTAAFAIDADWALPRYQAVSDTLDLGIAPLPRVPATGRMAAPVLNGNFLMLHRDVNGPTQQAALDFIAFMQRPAVQAQIPAALGRLPALRSALSDPAIQADPWLAAAAQQAENAPALPPTVVARCALYGIGVWLPTVLDGRVPAEEAPQRMQREAEACVNR
jgi:ABC-type glycerol-3-phosphate transport system substrate-binding protein